ncbi:hypothetical protein [Xanthomonas arboricola]|uniref:hypothetical protein n=1 Tax=Xanthomonas arboricola TaxID=56448 RepID=UPI001E282B1B|nr:hypothetical protein [Xanthomonas arboricola]
MRRYGRAGNGRRARIVLDVLRLIDLVGEWSMLALMVALALSGCAAQDAHYVLRDHPDMRAEFHQVASGPQWPSHLALRVHSTSSGRDAWFLPWNGGSDGSQHMASTTDVTAPGWHAPDPEGGPRPLGDVSYIGTDVDYRVFSEVPRLGAPAPAHFLLPDLREAVWYRAGSEQRLDIARQFFDLNGCAAHR